MEQWVGIALGLIVVIALIVMYMSRSSPMEAPPVPSEKLPDVPTAPPASASEPSPVIPPPVEPKTTLDSFPEALSFTSFKMTSELEENGDKTDHPKIVLPTAPEDVEMDHASMYTEWSK